jgi:hypothetical protein
MDLTGVAVRLLTLTVCLSALTGCAREETPPVADATAGYCVGIDKAHPADAPTTVTFRRGDQTLGKVGNVVTGTSSIRVTPGEVQILVDGRAATTMTLSSSGIGYATSGTGCPATLSP